MSRYNVYGMGNALVDIEFSVDDRFLSVCGIEKGLMTLVDEERQDTIIQNFDSSKAKMACGGSAANTVIGLAFFGGKAFYTCRVSDDEHGRFYLDDMQSAGVVTNTEKTVQDGITGKCLVMVSPDAERTMNSYLGVSETLSSEDLDKDALVNSDYLYIEGYLVTSDSARQAAIEAYNTARDNGVKVAMTFSDPAMVKYFKDGLREMTGIGVDLLFCNKEEAYLWAESGNMDDVIEYLKNTADTFCLTLGADGALVYDGEELIKIEPTLVEAVDTTGAGDLFAGAFIYGITNGLTFKQAGDLASRASAEVVAKFGPRLTKKDHDRILREMNINV